MEKMRAALPEVISIVACGPSAIKSGAMKAPGYVIAVNGAYEFVPHDAMLTMDGRFWREHAYPPTFLAWTNQIHVRRSAFKKFPRTWNNLSVYDCDVNTTTFGPTEKRLNGDHSGYNALNLAYVLKPKVVYLFGFDMGKPEHFFGQYEWYGQGSTSSEKKFRKWRADMVAARKQFDAAGIRVVNTNRKSRITAFEFGDVP